MPPELCRQKRIEAAQANTTRYVGSLYEEQGSSKTRHIFLGGTRIASVTNGKVSYVHTNHLGSTNVVTDDTGAIKELIEYEPWGTFAVHEKYATEGDEGSAAAVANFYFTGKPLDDETGLYYYGARYYNPVIGRFITADTIVPYASDPQSLNRYSYARNNPVNVTDPTGHKWSWGNFWKSLVGAVVGIIVTAMTMGAATPFWVAAMYGGMAGGALTGGLQGGWKGALMGAAIGGAMGGLGGWAGGIAVAHGMGGVFLAGTLAAGAGAAAATDSWDSFAGGLTGAVLGTGFVKTQQFQNFKAGNGFKSNQGVMDKMVKDGRLQEAADYSADKYGYQRGTYDPNNPGFQNDPTTTASTNPRTGDIKYSRSAFFNAKTGEYVPTRLQATGFHESQHYDQYLMDAPMWGNDPQTGDWGIINRAALEIDATSQTILNSNRLGLSQSEIYGEIKYYNQNADSLGQPHWQNQ